MITSRILGVAAARLIAARRGGNAGFWLRML
jgi:hypothetical protein